MTSDPIEFIEYAEPTDQCRACCKGNNSKNAAEKGKSRNMQTISAREKQEYTGHLGRVALSGMALGEMDMIKDIREINVNFGMLRSNWKQTLNEGWARYLSKRVQLLLLLLLNLPPEMATFTFQEAFLPTVLAMISEGEGQHVGAEKLAS